MQPNPVLTVSSASVIILSAAALVVMGGATAVLRGAQSPSITITYLYDNTIAVPGVESDWGFACLVEAHGRRVLFDTGTKPDVFRRNAAALKVDLTKLDAVVLSHDHADHTGGFLALGERPGLPVYYAQGFNAHVVSALRASRARLVPVSKGVEIAPGFRTSDEFGTAIREEALIVDARDGLVVVVGCAHPGIVSMLRQIRASTGKTIDAVVGGFHLNRTPPDDVRDIIRAFKALGIRRAGPTHCTGEEAIAMFKDAYGDDFVAGGVGTVVRIPQ